MNEDREIAKLRQQIEALEEAKTKRDRWWNKLTAEQKVAELLHTRQCHSNHTDGCSWGYEKWSDPGFAKNQYLIKARKLIQVEPNTDHLIEILRAM